MLNRRQTTIDRGAEPDALLGTRAVPDCLEHHLPADHNLHWPVEVLGRGSRKQAMGPRRELAAKPGA